MKTSYRNYVIIGIAMVLLLGYSLMNTNSNNLAAADQEPAKNTITVSGQGKVELKPDMANVTVGVTTEAKTARATQTANNQRMAGIMSTLKSLGISENDIQTVNYNLSPQYDYINSKDGNGKQVLRGYVATNQVQVTVRDINSVGKVLDAIVDAGANLSGGVSFTLSDSRMEQGYADALAQALKNGRGKAEVLAKGLGVTIGKPKDVSEGGMSPRPVVYNQSFDAMKTAAVSQVPVSAGQLEVSASVSLSYEY